MALVAVTVGFAALGAWIGRGLSGWQWFVPWLIAFVCLIGLPIANARGAHGMALTLLFAFGLLLGVSVGGTISYYARIDSTAVAQAAGATAQLVPNGVGTLEASRAPVDPRSHSTGRRTPQVPLGQWMPCEVVAPVDA